MAQAGAEPGPNDSQTPQDTSGAKNKPGRNQNACDGCRTRKIKCKYADGETRCRACTFVGIRCTHDRPRRRRGPPNRFSSLLAAECMAPQATMLGDEAAQIPLALPVVSPGPSPRLPTSPSCIPTTPSTPPSARERQPSSRLSLFAPMQTILCILNDWFDKIHALAPVLLRRRFLQRLSAGEADTDPTFCALVVSVCAATMATLPRGDYGVLTVDKCVEFVERHQLLQRGVLSTAYTVDWCIAMYNIGTSVISFAEGGMGDVRYYHALSCAAAGVRFLLFETPSPEKQIEQQLLRRLFWLLFAGAESADLFGHIPIALGFGRDNIPSIKPLPLTDDQLDQLDPQSRHDYRPSTAQNPWDGDETSYVPGLNSLCDLFMIWHNIQTTTRRDQEQPEHLIRNYFRQIQHVIDSLPPELRWRGGLSRSSNMTYGHDVQIANIFVTSLHIRSNILQKLGPCSTSAAEHQRIVDDLLEILYHLPPAVFDSNGSSLVPKIRDIGAAYLEQVVTPDATVGTAQDKLQRLLRKLEDLDCWAGLKAIHSPPGLVA